MIRQALVASVVILPALGIDLVLFPGSTDRFFSWPIEPPYTASVFAANYFTATLPLVLAIGVVSGRPYERSCRAGSHFPRSP